MSRTTPRTAAGDPTSFCGCCVATNANRLTHCSVALMRPSPLWEASRPLAEPGYNYFVAMQYQCNQEHEAGDGAWRAAHAAAAAASCVALRHWAAGAARADRAAAATGAARASAAIGRRRAARTDAGTDRRALERADVVSTRAHAVHARHGFIAVVLGG